MHERNSFAHAATRFSGAAKEGRLARDRRMRRSLEVEHLGRCHFEFDIHFESSSSSWPPFVLTLKPEVLMSAPWFVAPRASLNARCWMFTYADSPDASKMNPVGSALVSRMDAKRTQPSESTSSSAPSGRQIHRSLPRSSVTVGLRLFTDVT